VPMERQILGGGWSKGKKKPVSGGDEYFQEPHIQSSQKQLVIDCHYEFSLESRCSKYLFQQRTVYKSKNTKNISRVLS